MTNHPIIFNSAMVRAILDGRKTQTRRVIKPQPMQINNEVPLIQEIKGKLIAVQKQNCPYGKVGDTLWVREGFRIDEGDLDTYRVYGEYSAGGPLNVGLDIREFGLWFKRKYRHRKTSGRFMYKSLARIFLEITGIRVERVQEIDENGACAEGCELYDSKTNLDCVRTFERLWDSINAKRAPWKDNPWVWVVEFKRKDKK